MGQVEAVVASMPPSAPLFLIFSRFHSANESMTVGPVTRGHICQPLRREGLSRMMSDSQASSSL